MDEHLQKQKIPDSDFFLDDDAPLVLIVDDDRGSRLRHEMLLKRLAEPASGAIRIKSCSGISEAMDILSKTRVHVILLDKDLRGDDTDPDHNGIDSIPRFLHGQPHVQILVITGSKSVADSVQAIQLGALGYVTKESDDTLILSQIQRALDISQVAMQKYRTDRLRSSEAPSPTLGGNSRAFRQLLANAQLLAESHRPILLLGETGTGKTAIARYIHECRTTFLKQSNSDLISVNVAALPSDIVERELFGHEKGAYTDATESRVGYFELAGNSGTLFLDEIGEASLELQAKLLTAIETGEFFRLGGTRSIKARPKIVLATNRNLEEMVSRKRFREDLYMRISSFTLKMPTLAERKEDIPELVRALLKKCCHENNVAVEFKDIPHDFLQYLMRSRIDGNIRGLQHQLERLLVFSPRDSNRKPVLKNWRGIPGLYLKQDENLIEPTREAKSAITFRDFKIKPFDVIGPQFPGLIPFMKLIQDKILDEADKKFPTNAKIAEALQVNASYTSRLRRGIFRGKRIPTAARRKKNRSAGK